MTETAPDVPQVNELLFTIKLTSGDELLCVLVDEDNNGIIVEDPIVVRMIPVLTEDGMSNRMTTTPYMPFASQRTFYLSQADIITLTPMHSNFHKMYVGIVNQYMQTPIIDSMEPSSSSTLVAPVDTIQ